MPRAARSRPASGPLFTVRRQSAPALRGIRFHAVKRSDLLLPGVHLRADELRDGIIRDQRNPAQLPALADADELPVSKLLATIVEAPTKPEKRIAAGLRQAIGFRALRRTRSCDVKESIGLSGMFAGGFGVQ